MSGLRFATMVLGESYPHLPGQPHGASHRLELWEGVDPLNQLTAKPNSNRLPPSRSPPSPDTLNYVSRQVTREYNAATMATTATLDSHSERCQSELH